MSSRHPGALSKKTDPLNGDKPALESRALSARRTKAKEWAALALVLIVATVFLFSHLGAKYLWQDEAATAVLGARLMKFGKPLSYDGVNLITMDHFAQEDAATIDRRTGEPEAAIQYYANRGDFKADTTWIGQPWGQFVVVGASLGLFGRNTLAARVPFAVAALLTVALLYWFARQQFEDPLVAWLAATLLVVNVYWVIHSRQCRYYSLSGLFLLVTLIAFARWQAGRSFGGTLFVVAAWCWFQMDFGSFWPMIGILLAAAALTARPRVWRVLVVGAAMGAAVAPWAWFYELAGRLKTSAVPWPDKFLLNLFHVNQFMMPLVLLLLAGVTLWVRRRTMAAATRLMLAVSLLMLIAALVWVPTVAPYAFYRYIVHLTPLAAMVTAWVLCEGAAWVTRRCPKDVWRYLIAGSAAACVAVCPLLSNLVARPLQEYVRTAPLGHVTRPEWAVLEEEVFAPLPDPNRMTVEALKRVLSAKDEILINYEDIPLMFYTDNRIRGGIPCFRVEDSSSIPPRFLIYRRSVSFIHKPVFQREIMRYRWKPIDSRAPDIPWGNIPEPELRVLPDPSSIPEIIFAENVGPAVQ